MLSLKQAHANRDLDRNPHRLDHRRADPVALGRRAFVLFGAVAERRRRFCRAVGRLQDVDLTETAGGERMRAGAALANCVSRKPSRDGLESDQRVEAIVAAVALPDVADLDAAAALGEFRIFRQRQQLAATRAGRPPAIAFVQITHGHGDLERHGDSSVLGNLVAALCVILTVAASINRDSYRRLFIELLTFGEKLPQSGIVPAKSVNKSANESANRSANRRRSQHAFSPRRLFYLAFICAGSFRMVSGLPL